MSLNNVIMMGNLTRDPELRKLPSGKVVSGLSIANDRTYMNKAAKITEVSYFDVEVWGVTAENCSKYLTKGSGIIVEGRLKQDRWEKDGKPYSHVKIIADAVRFLSKKQKNNAGQSSSVPSSKSPVVEEAVVAASSEDAA